MYNAEIFKITLFIEIFNNDIFKGSQPLKFIQPQIFNNDIFKGFFSNIMHLQNYEFVSCCS